MITRREFTRSAAAACVFATSAVARAQTTRTTAPSERIRLGFIGVGNRGDQVLTGFLEHPDAEVVAICDLYQPYLDFAAKRIGTEVAQFKDYRKLLDRKDIDAVVISTPDHWHALHTIHACQAGKDVYIEKPLALSIAEGRAMVKAARHYNRVTQVGTHRRSSQVAKETADFIRNGGIGKVTVARCFHIQNEWPHGIGRPEDSQPPTEIDWDTWCGPAPLKPYNKNRSLYRYRWFTDYSGGQVCNTGVHYIDIIQWALGETAPRSVTALGGKLADFDNREIPDTLEAIWTYGKDRDSTLVTFSQFNANSAGASAKPCEIEFRGTKGTLYYSGGGYDVVPESPPQREFPILSPLARAENRGWREGKPAMEPVKGRGGHDAASHARNFLDCIKTREKCTADVETGHRSTSTTILANIAHKTHAVLDWDAEAERFTNNDGANKLLSQPYRPPYELPVIE